MMSEQSEDDLEKCIDCDRTEDVVSIGYYCASCGGALCSNCVQHTTEHQEEVCQSCLDAGYDDD